MECFIKKIFENNVDESVHSQFIRFGKGDYKGRALLSLHKTSKVKLKGSFEFVNDFVNLVSELEDVEFSGFILSKEKLELENEKKKSGIYSYEVTDINSEKVKELKDKAYYFLLNTETPTIKLKIKKKLPKPGKSEKKVDDKFCQLEADFKYYNHIKNIFFWDVPDCKKVKAKHEYEINDLVYPEDEKDSVQIRLKTKRKGKIIRKLDIDGREQQNEKDFEA
tara:strand:+ start:3496 stop:4161 length:666 start_codon:yes stop_codon:yes gene_type:complete